MLSSLFHPEIGSFSQFRLAACERLRLVQSLFGYHHLTLSLMERSVRSNLIRYSRNEIAHLPRTAGAGSQKALAMTEQRRLTEVTHLY
jgi:hypothetical protein